MRDITEEFYPMNIIHSRYSGTYSGGAYVMIAGSYNPREDTEAFGSDPDCMDFWKTVEEDGPVLNIGSEESPKEIYVDSGPNPSVIYNRFFNFCKDRIQKNTSELVTETLRDYPKLEENARDTVTDLHKLLLITEGRYKERNNSSAPYNNVKEELLSRFLEYDSIQDPETLSDEQKDELAKFVRDIEDEEKIDSLTISLQYPWIS